MGKHSVPISKPMPWHDSRSEMLCANVRTYAWGCASGTESAESDCASGTDLRKREHVHVLRHTPSRYSRLVDQADGREPHLTEHADVASDATALVLDVGAHKFQKLLRQERFPVNLVSTPPSRQTNKSEEPFFSESTVLLQTAVKDKDTPLWPRWYYRVL